MFRNTVYFLVKDWNTLIKQSAIVNRAVSHYDTVLSYPTTAILAHHLLSIYIDRLPKITSATLIQSFETSIVASMQNIVAKETSSL